MSAGETGAATSPSRCRHAELDLPKRPGLYRVWLGPEPDDTLLGLPPGSLLYVGRGRRVRTRVAAHVRSDKTSGSTLRRALGAVLREPLALTAHLGEAGDPHLYRFDAAGEERLTAWIHGHLRVSVEVSAEAFASELAVLARERPPLNLKDVTHAFTDTVTSYKNRCVDDARLNGVLLAS